MNGVITPLLSATKQSLPWLSWGLDIFTDSIPLHDGSDGIPRGVQPIESVDISGTPGGPGKTIDRRLSEDEMTGIAGVMSGGASILSGNPAFLAGYTPIKGALKAWDPVIKQGVTLDTSSSTGLE